MLSVESLAPARAAAIGAAQEQVLHRVQIVQLADHARDQTHRQRLAAIHAREAARVADRDVISNASAALAEEVPMLPAQIQRAVNKLLLQNVRHTAPETHDR